MLNEPDRRAIVFRPAGWEAGSDEVDRLTREGHLYRGMTEREWNSVKRTGLIQSLGAFSLTGEGTNFASHAADAESYVDYGRDDPRRTGRPNFLIEIPTLPGVERARDGYYKALAPIPASAITRAWKIVALRGALVAFPAHTRSR